MNNIRVFRIKNVAFWLIIFGTIINSCVVNKKVQYLQHNDVNIKTDALEKDSIYRTYELSDFEYKLQPEDVISVKFYSLSPQEFNFFSIKEGNGNTFNQFQNGASILINGYLIDENGEVEFPVVGNVNISGLSVYDAQNEILKVAEQYLESPVVEVRLLNFRFTLLGEVRKEGTIGSLNNRITMLEAIGLAGGFTDYADKSNVKIIRQSKGKAEVYYLNLLDESFINSPYYYMNQGDVIIIPPLKQRPYQIYFGKNLALVISSISILLIALSLFK
ncbi:MAG: polysaccharide biosynthesis/export family protein [Cyclobacteriaceae bacterium]|nr:polysaccharide biosynthesis/export family protein [Cyclobacteriaceae bacterium]